MLSALEKQQSTYGLKLDVSCYVSATDREPLSEPSARHGKKSDGTVTLGPFRERMDAVTKRLRASLREPVRPSPHARSERTTICDAANSPAYSFTGVGLQMLGARAPMGRRGLRNWSKSDWKTADLPAGTRVFFHGADNECSALTGLGASVAG